MVLLTMALLNMGACEKGARWLAILSSLRLVLVRSHVATMEEAKAEVHELPTTHD